MSDNIKVVVKVRPLILREIEDKLSYQWRINNNTLFQVDQNGRDCGPSFTFDKVYDTETRTDAVYNDIAKPIVQAATAGFNGTIFAYGQTSSGKTYTMTGTDDAPGIIPLAVINLFDIIRSIPDRDFLVRVSYVEIYNESFKDLLDLTKKVKIQETLQGIKVCTTEKLTISPDEVLELMRQGKANRQTGSTNMNEESSRSHSIFQITIESREHIEGEQEVGSVNVSQLNLVDLAGSERSGQTGATGIRFKEGTHINKSLSSLALVIKQLSEDPNKHVNYRDSKLTRILQNSLGGNAKTSIICAVTPAAVEETISTLQFANRAKAIKNTPAVNLVTTNATMIQSLTKQLSSLKTQLESKKSLEQDNYNLQKQIANLQKMILNGFGQNRNTDIISTARRKLIQPRRVTISTLHPIQEDPVPLVPKFCTPSLKYNPMSVGSLSVSPVQSVCSLPVVEETRDTNNYDVIEIDSDDENTSDIQLCSPYHKCYSKSKTPPCVLRKNAKQAEKNLKDIVELTEREKIYTPNVVELMEKLENKSLTLAKLEDNITNLHSMLNDKDQEMEMLKRNITKAQDEIKSITADKAKLEITCNNYCTKITDWEVSYETLKKKSKSREDELLSLLKELESKKKNETIGKLTSKAVEKELKNFMDLSRDISLVSSSAENSIMEIESRQNCCDDMRTKVTLRDQTIFHLEANLHAQKLKIENLENINAKLQETVSSLNDKILLFETENSNLKSSMESLNDTISSQKSLIEIANTDIESYGIVVRELQMKLNKKENAMSDISDADLEAMIANEEMFLANNENMKNIIQSLKIALDSRNKEINKLKSDLDNNQNLSSLEELNSKTKEISLLTNELEHLKNKEIDNISVIDTLLLEKNKMIQVEKQLTLNFTTIQEQKDLLEKEIQVLTEEMTKLKEYNNILTTEIKAKEEEIISINKENDNENRDLCQKINKLEAMVKNKEAIIASLKKEQNGTRENIEKAKLGVTKVQNIITLLTGDINVIPEFVDNLVVAFSTLSDSLTSLENIATDTIKEKKCVMAKLEQSEIELNSMQTKINSLSDTVDEFYKEYETLILDHLNKDECIIGDMNTCDKLINKITNLLSAIKLSQKDLNQTISDKNAEINESKINYENKLKELNEEFKKNNTQVKQICDLTASRNLITKNIFEKVTKLTSKFCIENNISSQFENACENVYEQVMLTIDEIDNYISLLQSEHSKCDKKEHVSGEPNNQIQHLIEENIKFVQDISDLETRNAILSDEIQNVQQERKLLGDDLECTNNLINQLRQNLSTKCNEMEIIENKAKSWKDSFADLEARMQDKFNLLEAENLKLKSKCLELEMQDLPRCYDNEESLANGDQDCFSRKHYIPVNSPPSLLTICCNRIADAIDLNDDKSVTSSSSCLELSESKISMDKCNCKDLLADLQLLVEEKNKLNSTIERLQNENEDLLKEREEVQNEVQLLLEHSYELQKRVVNHRTILSTLTATTYAENKSLSSQIKFLQHHHSRFHHVCQKVIPNFKRQLYDLMTLLQSESLGKHNESFKRYSLPNALDTSSLHSTFKNESIFDNDLLMLDTNVTLTTCDNTITAHDQTCFDVTQVWVSNEVACQTNFSEVNKDSLHPQMGLETLDENKIIETLESLKNENDKLRDLVDNFTITKSKLLINKQSSPIKLPDTTQNSCEKCDQYVDDIRITKESHKNEIDAMSKKLTDLECEKNTISEKFNNLTLEIPSSDALVRKMSALERDLQIKVNEIEKLTVILSKANKTLKSLQEENESLSNEIMENISEIDVLKLEQDKLKETNTNLTEKLFDLGKELKSFESEKKQTLCNNCALKDETIHSLKKRLLVTEAHTNLDRSYSDADSSSRYNKICTLQNELHAGKEDCIELKEEVTTIKKHLEHSNLSISQNMDLDESIIDSHNMYSFNKDYGNSSDNKINLSNVPDKSVIDLYISDKTDCLSYYCEKTGANKESLNGDFKIIEVMKMLYVNFNTKHANEIQNLVNKLKDLEEDKSENTNNLQVQFNKLKEEQVALVKELKEKDAHIKEMTEIVSHIRNNASLINEESEDALFVFRNNFLNILDKEFGLTSSNMFESILYKINEQHNKVIEKNTTEIGQLKEKTERMVVELNSLNDNILSLKSQLSEKKSEFELLQRQKEKMHEISNAVTIDIVRKENELRSQLTHYYRKLIESNIIKKDIDLSLPLNESLNILFNLILNELENKESEDEKHKIVLELENLKTSLLQKDEDLKSLRDDFNKKIIEQEQKLVTQTSLHNDLNKIYAKKVEENAINATAINKLTEEINILKNNVTSKDLLIKSLETKHSKELLERQSEQIQVLKNLQNVQNELEDLKSINQSILMEKEACAIELESVRNMLNQKNIEIDKFVSEINKLKQSLNENSQVIENFKLKSDNLLKQSQEKCSNCVRLETNIKTHEKTASIQITIINRLQEQKADFIKRNSEKDKQIEEISQKCKSLEEEHLNLTTEIQTAKEEIKELSSLKQTLELRISELETLDAKPRLSIDSVTETARRRRQSIHDSKRILADDVQDPKTLGAMLKSRSKTDDLSMDVDEDSSSRSTPIRLNRGRDSLLPRHDQSDKDEEQSRPGSAAAARRRRRTAHDHARLTENSLESSGSFDGEAAHFKRLLFVCQEELEELKQRYKEVDEECETCAQYLRERDEQCLRLKREKGVLENTIMDLREKMKLMDGNNTNIFNSTNNKTTFSNASVNTEEDWTNLHSVFVDRMSYDAEVDKNKKLARTIEELRFKKQDLKNTMMKMQKALDKKVDKDSQELESTKIELETCKQELEELKERYKELDEECETCAEYLRERDDQCQKLKEIKTALESKLEEYQQSSVIVQSVRKRRQTLHDQNRRTPGGVDVATDTSDDLLSYQVERDDSKLKVDETKEIKRLKMVVDKLSQQKTSLEQQLSSVGTQYVATGSAIVQNQQLSDVMKENQKLKKINAKLVTICKKRGKSLIDSNIENEDPSQKN